MKSKGIVFANDRHLEEIPLENLKGADLAGAAGGRDASSSLHFTHTTHLHEDSTATQGWQVVVLSLWRCVVRVKCKLEEASRPPAVPARSAPCLYGELALRLAPFLFKFIKIDDGEPSEFSLNSLGI